MSALDDLAPRRRNARTSGKSRGSAAGHGGGFVKVEWTLLDSPAYQRLSDKATRALMVLMRQHNGRNNGAIAASARWLGERMGCHYTRAAVAIHELIALGFIRVAQPGSFHTKNQPATFALTCFSCGDAPATKDYLSVPATSPAEPKRRRTTPTAGVAPTLREKHIPVASALRPVAQTLRDSSAGTTAGCDSSGSATMPVAQALQSIDLPPRKPAPSAAPVVAVAAAAVGAHGPSVPWSAADWRAHFDERLAMAMIDGELSEAEARALARQDCVDRWQEMHPGASRDEASMNLLALVRAAPLQPQQQTATNATKSSFIAEKT